MRASHLTLENGSAAAFAVISPLRAHIDAHHGLYLQSGLGREAGGPLPRVLVLGHREQPELAVESVHRLRARVGVDPARHVGLIRRLRRLSPATRTHHEDDQQDIRQTHHFILQKKQAACRSPPNVAPMRASWFSQKNPEIWQSSWARPEIEKPHGLHATQPRGAGRTTSGKRTSVPRACALAAQSTHLRSVGRTPT